MDLVEWQIAIVQRCRIAHDCEPITQVWANCCEAIAIAIRNYAITKSIDKWTIFQI
jgi:hypothetical protein